MNKRAFIFLVSCLWLPGCSWLPQIPDPFADKPPVVKDQNASWKKHLAYINSVQQWQLNGKLGIRTPDDSNSAYIDWQQQDKKYMILLSGPLGQSIAKLNGEPGHVELNTADRGRYFANTPEQLMRNELGWNLPVSNLKFWIRGIPAPQGNQTISLNPQGLLAKLKQADWTIHYDRYQQVGETWLPGKVRFFSKQLKLTFVIKDWQLSQ
ncbi:lipoprotein insertase outer membrane protein LolB [Spartinivicinus ruber]|uniref:lipoprotein insertase outer membrane protein LolB n=1 Tax=Spartinivicinus ruber TaxID=2683272 RepID=UPI0013D6B5E6|nr:lipoprotein insertase outer membrane protein LolB [Spartinivicinus ruber]